LNHFHLRVWNLDAFMVDLFRRSGANAQTRFCFGVSDALKHQVKRTQGHSGPLTTYRTEKAMFHRIPFRGSGREVAKRYFQIEWIGQFVLNLVFEKARTTIVAAARISENEKSICIWILTEALGTPPMPNGVSRKLGGIRRSSHIDKSMVARDIVNPVGRSNTFGIFTKIMSIHIDGITPPPSSRILEIADQLLFLCVNADHRKARVQEFFFLFPYVAELPVAVGVGRSSIAFAVGLQRMPFFFKSDRTVEWQTECPSFSRPFASWRRVWRTHVSPEDGSPARSSRIKLSRSSISIGSVSSFEGRPAPARRTRPEGQFSKSFANSCRPVRIVSSSIPVISEIRRIPPWPSCRESSPTNQRRWFSSILSRTRCRQNNHSSSSIQGVVSRPTGKTVIFFHFLSMSYISAHNLRTFRNNRNNFHTPP
jgi:hypothetical protein